MHDFSKDDSYCSESIACANVLETISGGTPVIPWKSDVAASLTHNFGEEKTWISREGIVIFPGQFSHSSFLRVPNAFNIFSAVAQTVNHKLALSSAGKTCEQIISAVGGLEMLGIVARAPELLALLDSLAHEDVEIEIDVDEDTEATDVERRRKRLFKPYAPLKKVLEVVRRSNRDYEHLRAGHLGALIRRNVLKVGLSLSCPECSNSSWFSLESLASKLPCPRCLSEFQFPANDPPAKEAWAYRVIGPFATGNYAHGAYCVASALHFLKKKVARESTWLPSFEMKPATGKPFEADFGMFASPNRFTPGSSTYMILGECKSFNRFNQRDFDRAREAAKLFPGAVFCFCTFNDSLDKDEIRGITPIALEGRERKDIGTQMNPVLILTGRELFGQFKLTNFYELYGERSQYANGAYMRGDIQELCDFTQQLYLGLPSYHSWLDEKRKKLIAKRTAAKNAKRK